MSYLTELIQRYEELRRRLVEIDHQGLPFSVEAHTIDSELVELERQLPANYAYPGDESLPFDE